MASIDELERVLCSVVGSVGGECDRSRETDDRVCFEFVSFRDTGLASDLDLDFRVPRLLWVRRSRRVTEFDRDRVREREGRRSV